MQNDHFNNKNYNEKFFKDLEETICKDANFILIDGVPNFFENGIYKRFNKTNIESLLYKHIPSNIKLRKDMREQLTSYLQYAVTNHKLASANTDVNNSRYIAFQNGVLDLETNILINFSPEIVVQHQLPMDYNPDADTTFVLNALSTWSNHNGQTELLLQEILGTAITFNRLLDKSFILLGPPRRGKSDFLEAVQLLVGDYNCSNLQLNELKKETHLANLYDKRVNAGDDIDAITIKDTGIFKRVVSHNRVVARQLYDMPFSFIPRTTLIFAANVLPNFIERNGDISKRLIVVPFENDLGEKSNERIDNFYTQLNTKENLEALALVAVSGLQRLRSNGYRYTYSSCDIHQSIDEDIPVVFYLKNIITINDLINKPVAEAYKAYVKWSNSEAEEPVSKKAFGLNVQSIYGLRSEVVKQIINGQSKTTRFYQKEVQ